MPKNNPYYIPKEYKKVEEVREIDSKYEIPTFEEFMRDYKSDNNLNYADLNSADIGTQKGYGPCRNSLCGCSCSSYTCKCESCSVRVTGANFTAHGRKWEEEIEPKSMEDLVLRVGGHKTEKKVGGQVSGSLFGHKDSGGELKVLSGTVGGEFGRGNYNVKASADLYNVKSDGVQVRVGVSVDTGIKKSDDAFEAKVAGIGFSIGKKTGISTPVGEIKIDTDDCVVQ